MDYSKRILSKEFCDNKSKNAYMKVCKYLAENIISNDKISNNVSYTITKGEYDDDSGIYKYILEVYVKVNEDDILNQHCNICKETHSSFFISEETNCNWCKIHALQRRIEEKVKVKQTMVKESIIRGKI